jgi:glycogen synthase
MTDEPAELVRAQSPSVSVIVCTDGRLDALKGLMASLRHQDYSNFEVCVVCGPTKDGTREYLEGASSDIKIAHCPERNLSKARNIGIALAVGEFAAFIDDDAIPEPEWLSELVAAFGQNIDVGAAGGVVHDFTGYSYQYLYAACDRLGNATLNLTTPVDPLKCYPLAYTFPYLQGTNCAFRRTRLVELGGFDEEYEFYLDETDLCCRLVDHGVKVAQLPNARVHHKFLPSHIRNQDKVTVRKYEVIKNKIYFSLMCNRGHIATSDVIADNLRFIDSQRQELQRHIDSGRLSRAELRVFADEVERAWAVGFVRGLSGSRRTRPLDYFDQGHRFLRYAPLMPAADKRALVFIASTYPADLDSTDANRLALASALGKRGHKVHVLTKGDGMNRVDLKDDIWVHRIIPRTDLAPYEPILRTQPSELRNFPTTMFEEVKRTDSLRAIDAVEGRALQCAAVALDGRFPVIINADDPRARSLVKPLAELEEAVLRQAAGFVATSFAPLDVLKETYRIPVDSFRYAQCAYREHEGDVTQADVQEYLGLVARLQRKSLPFTGAVQKPLRNLDVGHDEKGILVDHGSPVQVAAGKKCVYLTFWMHPWSGFVEINQDGNCVGKWDLFAPSPGRMKTCRIELPDQSNPLQVCRTGERHPDALNDEVIIVKATEADF